MKNTFKYILGLILISWFFACEKPLELNPAQSIDSEKLIVDASSAEVAMNGLYSNVQDLFGGTMTITMDVASDITDHTGTFPSWNDIDMSNPFPDNTGIDDGWVAGYALIYNANVVLDVLPTVDDPALDAAQFLGEARAIRAWTYFYLANIFGDVPLINTPVSVLADVNVAKSSASDVFNFVAGELTKSLAELTGGVSGRINADVVNAMLAKVYASTGNWSAAADAADAVIPNYTLVGNYMDLFNGSISSEAIFQIDFNSTDGNSLSFYYWDTPGGRHEIGPSQTILDALTIGDARSASVDTTINSANGDWYITKYADFALGTDKPILLRLADILLIKAEAEAEAGNYGDATTYFNMVRERSVPGGGITLDANNFKDAILNERMIELAWEAGHRWIDMQRSGLAASHVAANGQDGCKAKWPIPRAEIDANTAMVQNPCY